MVSVGSRCSDCIDKGTKHINPFGIVGTVVRRELKGAIRKRYPKLDGDIKDGGMASLIKDIVIDLDVLDDRAQDDELASSSRNLVAEDSDEDNQQAYTSAEVGNIPLIRWKQV